MGRGARPTVRWKHDRIRRKKQRDKRRAAGDGAARAQATGATRPA